MEVLILFFHIIPASVFKYSKFPDFSNLTDDIISIRVQLPCKSAEPDWQIQILTKHTWYGCKEQMKRMPTTLQCNIRKTYPVLKHLCFFLTKCTQAIVLKTALILIKQTAGLCTLLSKSPFSTTWEAECFMVWWGILQFQAALKKKCSKDALTLPLLHLASLTDLSVSLPATQRPSATHPSETAASCPANHTD